MRKIAVVFWGVLLFIPLQSKASTDSTEKLGIGFAFQAGIAINSGFEIKVTGYLKQNFLNVGAGIANLNVSYLTENDTRLYIPHISAMFSSPKAWGFGKFDVGLPKTIQTTVPDLKNGMYYSLSLGVITNEFVGLYGSVTSLKYWYFDADRQKKERKVFEMYWRPCKVLALFCRFNKQGENP